MTEQRERIHPANQTQAKVEVMAQMATREWIESGPRTLERLNAIADAKAKRFGLPRPMVRSTALNFLKDRAPDLYWTLMAST
jgi:hypothetical protein